MKEELVAVVPAGLSLDVADGEQVAVVFEDDQLVLRFIDWHAQHVEQHFADVLAFRWSSKASVNTPRDDAAYEVLNSCWLAEELALAGATLSEHTHYVLCFNAAKVLEILSRRVAG